MMTLEIALLIATQRGRRGVVVAGPRRGRIIEIRCGDSFSVLLLLPHLLFHLSFARESESDEIVSSVSK